MKQTNSWAIFAVLLCLALLIGCSSESKTLKLSPSKLDFEEVNLGDIKDIEVTLTNKYGESITINSLVINGSGNFAVTAGNTAPITIEKGEEHKITISFEPTSSGEIEGTLVITHTGSEKPKEAPLFGVGVPVARVELSDTSYDFGNKLINKSHDHVVTVKNIGTANLSVTSMTFSGANGSLFSISAGDAPFDITPGATHDFTITYSPVAVGNHSADINISSNAVGANIPLIYPVSGAGIDVDPQITLSESSPWDFGSVATTMPTRLNVEISNTGTDPLTVTSAVLQTGTVFTVDTLRDSNYNVINFPYTLQVGEKIYLWIEFAPTSKTTFNDTLTIVHDGTNEVSPWDFAIKGEGRDEIVKTFTYNGASEQFKVPANVSMIKVEAYGAAGGNPYPPIYPSSVGGKGGKVEATFTVTPGITLNIYVGGQGGTATSSTPGKGGWNGGAVGSFYSSSYSGGGGGGGSDIRVGGNDYSKRIIAAGAGAGSGNAGYGSEGGGAGGGLTGGKGLCGGVFTSYECGSGGTQTAGGAAAQGGGSAGKLGEGGAATNSTNWPGGGGGGGYYGGGGGYLGGGGGGSSFTNSGASNVNHTQGIRSGDGEITITY